MAIKETFEAIIAVVDKATAPLRSIARRIEGLTAPLKNTAEHLRGLGEHVGLDRLKAKAHGVAHSLEGIFHQATRILGPLEALAISASIGGLVAMTVKAAEAGAKLYDLSVKTGISANTLAVWHYAAQRSGTDAEVLDKAVVRLNKNLGEAAVGKNKSVAALMRHLGINLKDARGHMRDVADILPEIAEGFAKNEDPTLRTRMAMALFGKAGADLIPMLEGGRHKLDEFARRFRHFRGVVTQEGVKAAKDFYEAWKDLELAAGGVFKSISKAIMPVLQPIVVAVSEWLVTISEDVADAVKKIVVELRDLAQQVDWSQVIEQTKSWATWLRDLVAAVGGLKTVLLVLVATALAPLVTAITTVGTALVSLGAALLATPIGWFIGIVAALAGAAYLIYDNWGPISEWFKRLWANIADAFSEYWTNRIKPIVDAIKDAFTWIGRQTGGRLSQLMGGAPAQPGAAITAGMAANRVNLPELALRGVTIPAPVNDNRAAEILRQTAPGAPPSAADRLPLARELPPPLYLPQQRAAPAPSGEVKVKVEIEGAPAGTRVDATSSGTGIAPPELDVGYNLPGMASGF